MFRWLAPIAAIAGALLLALIAAQPPAPAPADAPADRFSAVRAMADIRRIAAAPHPTGSAEDARVRDYLARRLRALGLAVRIETAPLSPSSRAVLRQWRLPAGPQIRATDVVGVLPGRDREAPAVLLMAHHDTVAGSPGAADDSAGVAAILEAVRALRAGPAPARDLVVLFPDAEELGSDGAAAFFRDDPLARRLGAVVNLEARGGGGRALMFETGPRNGPMMALFARAVGRPSTNSAAVLIYRLLPNHTDFTIPKAAGLTGFNFAFLGRPRLYHAPQATPDLVDVGSVQHIGGQMLDVARALILAPRLPPPGQDAVFSDLFGLKVLAYPPWVGWAVLAAAAALLAVAAARVRSAGLLTVAGAFRGAGAGLGVLLVAGGGLELVNAVSGAGPHANYYDRLAAIPRLELQALTVCLAVVCLLAGGRRRDADVWSGWLGLAVLVLAAATAVQARAPEAAPVLAWPLLLCAALAAWTRPSTITGYGDAAAWLAASGAAGAAYVLGLAHFAFLAIGPDVPGAMAAFALLVVLLVWPLLPGAAPTPVDGWAAAALFAFSLGLALWVRLDPPAPTIPVYARACVDGNRRPAGALLLAGVLSSKGGNSRLTAGPGFLGSAALRREPAQGWPQPPSIEGSSIVQPKLVSERRPDVDTLRVLLFGGLIAYHLGLMYAAWSPYALKSNHTATWVEGLLLMTHPWRMCLLFLISGVATRFAADKLGVSRLFVSRSAQLLPPLLFGIVFLAPIQGYLTVVETAGYTKGYLAFLPELFAHGHTVAVNGQKIALPVYAHLWFVFYLWTYMLVLALALWAAPKWVGWIQPRLEQVLSGAGLLLWPLAVLIMVRLSLFPVFGMTLHFYDDWNNHVESLGMFLFGFVIARSDKLWDRFAELRWPALGLAVTGWALYALMWGGQGIPEWVERSHPVMQLLYPLERWGAIVAVLGFARRHLTRDSRLVRYLNGGMFTYYIVHQPALLLMLHHVKPLGLDAGVEAAVVLAGTVAACALTYELARTLGWFGLLMGVRPPGARLWKPAVPVAVRTA